MKRQWTTIIKAGYAACILAFGLTGCIKEDAVTLSGPLNVTLNVNTRTGGDMTEIKQLRIYAFHVNEDETRTLTGYTYHSLPDGKPVTMRLQEAGQTEFRVIANERYGMANQQECLNSNMSLNEIDNAIIPTFSLDTEGEFATPMTNPKQSFLKAENRIFSVSDTENTKITIELERCVSRVHFYFAKTEQNQNLTIDQITFNLGIENGYLFLPADASDYGQWIDNSLTNPYQRLNDIFGLMGKKEQLETPVTVSSLVDENETIASDNSQNVAEGYVFPCPYGSNNPNQFVWNDGQAFSSDYSYYAIIAYTVNGQSFNKYVYLPPVGQNEDIDVLCKIPPSGVEVQPTLVVRTQAWDKVENDVEFN